MPDAAGKIREMIGSLYVFAGSSLTESKVISELLWWERSN
jgi:hypothetical protein